MNQSETTSAAGGPLWCMHIQGPDDLHAAPDFWTALAWAAELNSFIAEKAAKGNWKADDNYPLSQAVVRQWTGTPESHAVQCEIELADRAEHEAKRKAAALAAPTAKGGTEGFSPKIETCPKCGSRGAAFVCSEVGCPVNGGAAYPWTASPPPPAGAAYREGWYAAVTHMTSTAGAAGGGSGDLGALSAGVRQKPDAGIEEIAARYAATGKKAIEDAIATQRPAGPGAPSRCIHCDAPLTAEEREFYSTGCERCMSKFHAAMVAEDLSLLPSAPTPDLGAQSDEPFAYAYEMASRQEVDGTWTSWCRAVDRAKPGSEFADGQVRYVTPLYPKSFCSGDVGAIDRIDYLERQLAACDPDLGAQGEPVAEDKRAAQRIVSARLAADTDGYGSVDITLKGGLRVLLSLDAPHRTDLAENDGTGWLDKPLPETIDLDGVIFAKGVRIGVFVDAARRYYRAAKGASRATEQGDLAALSAGATQGQYIAKRYDDGACGAYIECDGMQISASMPEEDALYLAEAGNAYRSGRLIEAPTPDLGAQGEPVAMSYADAVRRLYAALPDLTQDEAQCVAEAAFPELLREGATLAPAAPRPGSGVSVGEIADLKDRIRLKASEPSLQQFQDALGANLTEAGYLLGFKLKSTGTTSMWVRLSSGREIIVDESEWAPATAAQAPRDGGETQGGSATETEREPNAAVTAEIERGLARCSDPVRYAIRKEASDLIGLHAPGNRHLEQAVIAALLRRTAQSQKGTAR